MSKRTDSERLDWWLSNSAHISIHGDEESDYFVADSAGGMTIIGIGPTPRSALDAAMDAEQE